MSSLRNELTKQLIRRQKEVLIKEAIIAIVAEQALEAQPPVQQQPVAPQNPPVSPEAGQEQPPAAPPNDEVTIDGIIEKLNVIRGGTSFSDPEVYGQLTTFWNNLPEDQRVNIDNQLNNIGKIVSIAEPDEAQQQAPTNTPPVAAPPAPPTAAPGTAPVASGAPISPA